MPEMQYIITRATIIETGIVFISRNPIAAWDMLVSLTEMPREDQALLALEFFNGNEMSFVCQLNDPIAQYDEYVRFNMISSPVPQS